MKGEIFIKGIVPALTCVGMMGLFTGCFSDDEYRDTLNSGLEKYYFGDDMTKEEYVAVKGFNAWKDKQSEKNIVIGMTDNYE